MISINITINRYFAILTASKKAKSVTSAYAAHWLDSMICLSLKTPRKQRTKLRLQNFEELLIETALC